MGKSENIKAVVTAMVTAGVLQGLSETSYMQGMKDVNAQSPFTAQLQKNVINNTSGALVNHAINGGDLQQQLEQSLKNTLIDTGAAQGANLIGDMKENGKLDTYTHKLAHAIAGCAAGAAKSDDCRSGALGAVVGEITAELYAPDNTGTPLTQQQKTDTIGVAKIMAGVAAAVTGNDVNLAAAAGGNAAENNYLSHWQQASFEKEMNACKDKFCQLGTRLRWGMTSVKQDAALVTGMALGATFEAKDVATALIELPGTIKEIANNPELLKQLPAGYVQDLQTTYTEYQTALEDAGVDGATAAGVKLTHLLAQLSILPAAAATGGAALTIGTEKVVGVLGKVASTTTTALVDGVTGLAKFDNLVAKGGLLATDGTSLMDFSTLTSAQKGMVGELLGANTIENVLPGAQKIGRSPSIGQTGIDDLYKADKPGVDYVVVEYKFGTSTLGNTADGLQMSDGWLTGKNTSYDRILESVSNNPQVAKDISNAMEAGRIEKWVVNTDKAGGTSIWLVDAAGKIVKADSSVTSKILGGAK